MSGEPDLEADTATDYRVIATTAIPEITEVWFYDETRTHIVENHPELGPLGTSLDHAIDDTIANPTEVLKSNPPHDLGYKFCSSSHLMGGDKLVIPVKVVKGSSALLKTAYFTDAVTGKVVRGPVND